VPAVVRIRQAGPDDAPEVAAVLNAVIAEREYTVFDRPFSDEAEREFLASLGDRQAVFVAEIAGTIVGVQSIDLLMSLARSMDHVATLGTWLRPDVRGRGIGRRLAEQSFAFARSAGYSKVVIQVLAHNERALRFYRGLGITDIGIARQHVRLDDTLRDEVYLEKLF
jgi:RimJ/RimL family protein N-acetyltransferase